MILLLSALPVGLVAAATHLPASRAAVAPAGGPSGPNGSVKHVILIVDENQNYGTIMHNASYFKGLTTTGAQASNFWAYRPDSEPAYVAETSGIIPTGFSPGGYPVTNLGDLVTEAGGTWGSYLESMPGNCIYSNGTGAPLYDRTHNPFVQYADIYDSKSTCDTHVQPLTAWNSTVVNTSAAPPTYSLIVPNTQDDMDVGTVAQGNAWLERFITPLMSKPWWNQTVVMLTFDEAGEEHAEPVFNGTTGGHVYFDVLADPFISSAGENSTTFYTFFNVLTTTEWLLGLGGTGNRFDNWSAYPPMYSLFNLPHSTGSARYSVSGMVQYPNGTAASGATVQVSGNGATNTSLTGSSGTFSFDLLNGDYTLTAAEAGFTPGLLPVTVNGSALSGLVVKLVALASGYYSVSGAVYNATGPLSGATINITETASSNGNLTNFTQATGSPYPTGVFNVPLQAGTYNVTANASGYANETRSITV
ncbi:MAG: carboxypeptidase regulatory-like domain-containing protein, partial [Thermoplasmata archaeon]